MPKNSDVPKHRKEKLARDGSPEGEMDPELVRNPPQMPDSSVKFTENVISTCIAKGFKKSKTKVAGDAVQMMEWATRVYVLELLCRCAQEAQKDRQTKVDETHLERILAQFMLDFS